MTTTSTDTASYLRGRLHMAGIGADSPLSAAVDVLQVLILEIPREALDKWRRELDIAVWKVRPPDRSTWGLRPDQQAATERLIGQPPGAAGAVADTRASRPATLAAQPGRAPQRPSTPAVR